ncbi:hypothetical protein DV515_00006172 [Chloebia gouldiae]|uniref:Uncharacterized protein n=1 Tax=Chloebia gouldiae TaxID=44316 RepID=A0A3L8SLH5_CHLGU|nr:hypothetical protein DV515_00006172 [Chloebia gouldiae]
MMSSMLGSFSPSKRAQLMVIPVGHKSALKERSLPLNKGNGLAALAPPEMDKSPLQPGCINHCLHLSNLTVILGAGEHQEPHTTAAFEGFYSKNHQPSRKLKNAGRESDYMWSSPGEPQKSFEREDLESKKLKNNPYFKAHTGCISQWQQANTGFVPGCPYQKQQLAKVELHKSFAEVSIQRQDPPSLLLSSWSLPHPELLLDMHVERMVWRRDVPCRDMQTQHLESSILRMPGDLPRSRHSWYIHLQNPVASLEKLLESSALSFYVSVDFSSFNISMGFIIDIVDSRSRSIADKERDLLNDKVLDPAAYATATQKLLLMPSDLKEILQQEISSGDLFDRKRTSLIWLEEANHPGSWIPAQETKCFDKIFLAERWVGGSCRLKGWSPVLLRDGPVLMITTGSWEPSEFDYENIVLPWTTLDFCEPGGCQLCWMC